MAAAWRSWALRGVAEGVAEEARTHGFASRAFARFAFIADAMILRRKILSIRGSTQAQLLSNRQPILTKVAQYLTHDSAFGRKPPSSSFEVAWLLPTQCGRPRQTTSFDQKLMLVDTPVMVSKRRFARSFRSLKNATRGSSSSDTRSCMKL